MMQARQEVSEGSYTVTDEIPKPKNYTIFGKDQGQLMTREFAIGIHYKVHKMSLEYMKNIKKLPHAELIAETQFIM